MPVHSQPSKRGRRADHEGSIYQLKSGPRAGEWRAQVSLANGQRRSYSGRSEDEVKQKLLDARWELSHGLLTPPRGETFAEYSRGWLLSRRHELSPRSQYVYRRVLEQHVWPIVGDMALVDIERAHVRQLQLALFDKGLKAKTVRLVHGVLSAVLAQAEDDGLIVVNVARKVKLPKAQKVVFVPLDPDEVTTLIGAMRGDALEALFLLIIACGLRRSEACGVHWRDFNLERGTLRLSGKLARTSGSGSRLVFESFEKSESGRGLVIDLAVPVADALLAHRDRQAFVKGHAGELWIEQDYVFTDAVGGPLDPMQAWRAFKALLGRAHLRDQRLHDLRHATASLLVAWGVDLALVSKLLRHASLSITADIYAHLYRQTGRELADRMGAFIEGAR